MRWRDVLAVGTLGLRSRPSRSALTALGVALAIAAMVAVVGISASSRADLLARIDRLGTNLLQVQPGQDALGRGAELPATAPSMIRRIGPVESAAATRSVPVTVRRSDRIPLAETGGIEVLATEPELLPALGARVGSGRFLDAATARVPTVVLGEEAARRLGLERALPGSLVDVGGQRFAVLGILEPVPLGPDIDRAALIGWPTAQHLFGIDDTPTTIRVRTDPDHVDAVRAVLAATVDPLRPGTVGVTRPSDALLAKAEADRSLTALLLGLAAVALVVGGVGIANTLAVSVLERRTEIGLRRALGATRRAIRGQFLVEAVVLAGLGSAAGAALGALATACTAVARGWPVRLPLPTLGAGLATGLLVGVAAGVRPAARAARLTPVDALRPAG